MPDGFTLYLLILGAIALGYLLGRSERKRQADDEEQQAMNRYYKGLDFVLREPSDVAVERFVESMPVDEGTVDTHLALGAVLRHRGEADKAVRIHQNLIAQASLSDVARSRAEFELARDYFAAGLLGRAESLLVGLIGRDEGWRGEAEGLLVDIYQRERDWQEAIQVAERLAKKDVSIRPKLAHFHCELAEAALADGELQRARKHLSNARGADAKCGRAYLIEARLEEVAGRAKAVRKSVNRALNQNPDLAVDAAPMFERACIALEDQKGWIRYLEAGLPFDAGAQLLHRLVEAAPGDEVLAIVERQLSHAPTLAGIDILLAEWRESGKVTGEVADALSGYLAGVPVDDANYRCNDCGFAAHTRHWQCPSCHGWDSAQLVSSVRPHSHAA